MRGEDGQTHGPRRSVTIYDVAEAAGVATSTVSRAFSTPDRVSARTREHVLEVAQRLGYGPNPHAQALPSGRTRTIALLVPDITNPHFFPIIRGAERQAAAAGLTLIMGDTEESSEVEQLHTRRLAPSVDGFVLASSRLEDADLASLTADHTVVLVNREAEGLRSVVVDQREGTRQMVAHLASQGHRTLVHLGGPRRSWLGAARWRELSAAARRAELSVSRIGPYQPKVDAGPAAADAALQTGATAIVAYNDLLAIGVLQRLTERGLRVPDDVSVTGFDDIFGADFCSPPLTTLAGPWETAGRSAVDLLLGAIDPGRAGDGRQRVVLPGHLVIRASTGPVPARAP